MKKVLYVFLVVAFVGLLGGATVDADNGFSDYRDFLSCEFNCNTSSDGFKEITILSVVNQGAPVEGCVDIVVYTANGHHSLGTSIKMNHNDLDKLNICKMLYEAKRAGVIDYIPPTGNLQVRLPYSWWAMYGDLENFSVNAWITNYIASTQFAWRESEVAFNKVISSSKTNCNFVTKDHEYPKPEVLFPPVFIQDTGGPGDWYSCAPGPTGPTGPH
jgi:hypothetical protein